MMRNQSLLLALASLLLSLSSVDAFALMARPTAPLSKTAIRAEVDDMPVAEIIPDVPDVAAAVPDVAAAVPDVAAAAPAAAANSDTPAFLIESKAFAPPSAIKHIDPDGPQPPPQNPVFDIDTIGLVVGQENYGFAIVLLGEAIWSFSKAPSIDHGVKTLLPAIVAAGVLGIVSGPMVTSGDAASVSTGLLIATGVSVAMGLCYAARLSAPFSPSPKEIPGGGLVVAFAGFFSFSQNLLVDGFVTLPSLPTIPLPSLPSIDFPSLPF
jgi:hypothetical protein